MAHKVRTHKWVGGILSFTDHFFEELEEALGFAQRADADTVKVYDANEQIVHQATNTAAPTNTYA